MQGVKHDEDKPRVDLVPVNGILAAARAFGYGAEKYTPWNWANGLAWLRLYGAILRHLFAWAAGEDKDPESGLSHLDHALASLMMLQAHVERGLGEDDRHLASDPLPPEAFSSYEEPEECWRIALRYGDSLHESDYFEGERFGSRTEAEMELSRAVSVGAINDAAYVIERVG